MIMLDKGFVHIFEVIDEKYKNRDEKRKRNQLFSPGFDKIKKRNNDFFKDKRRKKDWTLNYTCILRLLVFFFQHQKS